MRRIYFIFPDLETTRKVVEELLLARIEERYIHVVAPKGAPLEEHGIPEASLTQSTDLIPAAQRGAGIGWVAGLAAGGIAWYFLPAGITLGTGVVLGAGVIGAFFGALAASLVGVGLPSSRLERFHPALERGELLMMVDVPKRRVEEIEDLVQSHHPEARDEGTESHIPAFP